VKNVDDKTVAGFGDEWERFDQIGLETAELKAVWDSYFDIFPWALLPQDPIGFDLGCGSGRWARLVAPRVKTLHCIDPSSALEVAKKALVSLPNCVFHEATVDSIPLADASMDFGYSLGVLHHVPDTQAAIRSCVDKLKPGGPLLLYLYYAFDNRPKWFQILWRVSDMIRRGISRLPHLPRYWVSQVIALTVYWPLARVARLLSAMGLSASLVDLVPLSFYRDRSFYVMRTDALDRFGTRLEQRFTQQQIREMMERAGLVNIRFSSSTPYWCAVGVKAAGGL
jgi:ubiquinone/menaquinone biosynthesis C-methylase UbiE